MLLLKPFKVLKASSVVESVMAIAIISVCALIGVMVYLNVITLNKPIHYFNAKHKVAFLIEQSIEEHNYDDDSYVFQGYTIDKKVTINTMEHIAHLKFVLNTGNKTTLINTVIPYYEE